MIWQYVRLSSGSSMSSNQPLRILQILYFYAPYRSGLTIYAERLCEALAARGHQVTVLCARHDSELPEREQRNGVDVHRLPVATSFGRAVVLPMLIPTATRLMSKTDIVHLSLPLAEAAPLASIARLRRKRLIATHMADLDLSDSLLSRVASDLALWSGIGAGRLAAAVATNTASRAKTSPTIRRLGKNVHIIPPPIETRVPTESLDAFRKRFNLGSGPVVGFVGRMVFEKGIDVLTAAMPALIERFPDIVFAFVGPTTGPNGDPLTGPWDPDLDRYANQVRRLGPLSWDDLASFYAAIDLLVLPSTNITETFGMVQVEAMLTGTPVVASDLDGVREPIERTGMGKLARTGDRFSLVESITTVLNNRDAFIKSPESVEAIYSLDATVSAYERLYRGETA